MSRSGTTKYRPTPADPIFGSASLTKLINRSMLDGKKSLAQSHVYAALDLIKSLTKQDPLVIFDQAIKNTTPQLEVRSRRVGGAAYQVPMPVRPRRGLSLAIRWLVTEARRRPHKEFHTFPQKLAAEILAASNNEGGAITKKLTVHRQAEANKAFAHFRW